MNDNLKHAAFKYRALLIRLDTATEAFRLQPDMARDIYTKIKADVESFENDYEDDLHLIVEFSEKYLA